MFPSACAVAALLPVGAVVAVTLRQAIRSDCFDCQFKTGIVTNRIARSAPMAVIYRQHRWLGLVEQTGTDEALIHTYEGGFYFRLSEACLIELQN